MGEFVNTGIDKPEMVLERALRDPQGDEHLSADAQTFVASISEDDLHAYQITGDRNTIVGQMTPAFRQDIDCAIALTDAVRFVSTVAETNIDAADQASNVGNWKIGAAESSLRDLLLLRTALRLKPISVDPEADVASVNSLINCLEATAAIERQQAWISLQHRNLIMRASAVPQRELAAIRTTLVGNIAALCQAEDDPTDNLEFWTEFVNEGADVVSEEREAQVIKLSRESAARQVARPALQAA